MMPTLARPARTPKRPASPWPASIERWLYRVVVGGMLLATAACSDQAALASGSLADQTPPTVKITGGAAPTDSTIAFSVAAADNLGLLNVRVSVSGPGFGGEFDTTFTAAVTSVTLPYVVAVPSNVPPGTTVTVIASATDGARNSARPDTAFIGTGNQSPSVAVITNPTGADTAVVGFSIAVSLSGKTPNGVKALGYIASGVFASTVTDSVLFSSPLKDSVAIDTSLDLSGATTGTLTITPFLMDSLNRRFLGVPVNVVVLGSAGANTVPVVDFGITSRIEVTDTIHVKASDRAGIRWLGYQIQNLPSDPTPFSAADSFQVTGNVSSTLHTFLLKLNITNFPKTVQVTAFATNDNGRRAFALLSDGVTVREDTVTVVAGLTRGLPNGGMVADALYHPPTDRLYLSNITKNQLEVFDLADSSFKDPILTGSNPWGIAAWPLNRDGTMSDTLLVANSGGTTISKVNVQTGQEFTRYPLPNIIVNTVTSESAKNGGELIEHITPHDFSDRPQYLATTCKGPPSGAAPCGDVVLVYSTTPTPGQTSPFNGLFGTVRWEDLSDSTSHFFFEQAEGQTEGQADTLEIDRHPAQGAGTDTVLVPFRQQVVVSPTDTINFSIVVRIPLLGFRDTTFVRNSGNFRRAVIGEGGSVLGSRAMMFDVTQGMGPTVFPGTAIPLPVSPIDNGISRPVDVSDFIANTFTGVTGAAINFDGELAAIRGDSTYIIDRTLRLQGLLPTTGGNPGFDFHPLNAGIGPNTSPAGTRLSFAASALPEIEVYDTYTFRRCLVIPTRDPIIGPIKSAVRKGSNDVVLVGATTFGVVIVTVTQAELTSCS